MDLESYYCILRFFIVLKKIVFGAKKSGIPDLIPDNNTT
jgi:hypothetical protein